MNRMARTAERYRLFLFSVLILFAGTFINAGSAQETYPTKPIDLVVPYPLEREQTHWDD